MAKGKSARGLSMVPKFSVVNAIEEIIVIIIIMDLQMVEDDYFYNTIHLTVKKITNFRPFNQTEGIAPKHKIAKKAA